MNPRKKHNRRVKVVTVVMVIVAIISGLSLDSDSWIPAVTLGVSLIYLSIFCKANME